jgi:pilus assembly protein CpaF
VRAAVVEGLRDSGIVLGLDDLDRTVRAVRDELLGAGPLQRWLDDPAVTDVLVNGPEQFWVGRLGRLSRTDTRFASAAEIAPWRCAWPHWGAASGRRRAGGRRPPA